MTSSNVDNTISLSKEALPPVGEKVFSSHDRIKQILLMSKEMTYKKTGVDD